MRILLLNYEYPPLGGGAGNATARLLEHLVDTEIRIDLVTSSADRSKIQRLSENISIHFLDIGKKAVKLHDQSMLDLLRFSTRALRAIRSLADARAAPIDRLSALVTPVRSGTDAGKYSSTSCAAQTATCSAGSTGG